MRRNVRDACRLSQRQGDSHRGWENPGTPAWVTDGARESRALRLYQVGIVHGGEPELAQFRLATWAFMFSELFQPDDPPVDHLRPAGNTTPARRATPANPVWVGLSSGARGETRRKMAEFRQKRTVQFQMTICPRGFSAQWGPLFP